MRHRNFLQRKQGQWTCLWRPGLIMIFVQKVHGPCRQKHGPHRQLFSSLQAWCDGANKDHHSPGSTRPCCPEQGLREAAYPLRPSAVTCLSRPILFGSLPRPSAWSNFFCINPRSPALPLWIPFVLGINAVGIKDAGNAHYF